MVIVRVLGGTAFRQLQTISTLQFKVEFDDIGCLMQNHYATSYKDQISIVNYFNQELFNHTITLLKDNSQNKIQIVSNPQLGHFFLKIEHDVFKVEPLTIQERLLWLLQRNKFQDLFEVEEPLIQKYEAEERLTSEFKQKAYNQYIEYLIKTECYQKSCEVSVKFCKKDPKL